jgi:hypothetical protein
VIADGHGGTLFALEELGRADGGDEVAHGGAAEAEESLVDGGRGNRAAVQGRVGDREEARRESRVELKGALDVANVVVLAAKELHELHGGRGERLDPGGAGCLAGRALSNARPVGRGVVVAEPKVLESRIGHGSDRRWKHRRPRPSIAYPRIPRATRSAVA